MSRAMKESGIPWIGAIPQDWGIGNIGKHVKEVRNLNLIGIETNALQFKMGTIIPKSKGNSSYTPESLELYNIVEPGVVMINGLNLSFDFMTQRVALVRESGVITSAYVAVMPYDAICSNFLTYLFKSYDTCKAFHSMGKGLRQTLSYNELKKYLLVIPTHAEQRAIGDFLDVQCEQVDELIALQEQMIDELKVYKQSVITQAVTKGLNPDAPLKDSGIEWIGQIPEHWKIVQFKRCMRIYNGKDYKDIETAKGYPVIGSGGVFARASNYIYDGEVLLLGRKGTINKPLHYIGKFWAVDTMFYAIIQKKNYCRYFYYQAHTFPYEMYSTSTALPSMTSTALANNMVCNPSNSEQQQIADYLDKKCAEIDEITSIKQQKIEQLKEYKKSVIYEYATGKKQVNRE